ncbi:HOOK protein-domain-containing protein [Cladochytrium replicatum]|nr:HOOK protein-domain-containing protein [Cladochytrium replicatum]
MQVDSIRELADGAIFYEVLCDIDPNWFRILRNLDPGDNWVLKFNNLKKVYKLIIGYYEEVLGQSTVALAHNAAQPNFTAIARDMDEGELVKLAQLVLGLAVQSARNQMYIEKIQSLDEDAQHAIMLGIEEVMAKLGASLVPDSATSYTSEEEPARQQTGQWIAERQDLERFNQALREQLESLQAKLEETMADKRELQNRLHDMESTVLAQNEGVQIDVIRKTEINHLKADLDKSEGKRLESDITIEKQSNLINELTRKLDDAQRRAEEAVRLRDQLDEFRHMADRLQKSEALLEKYKKKLEESSDLRKQIKSLEDANLRQMERADRIEEEYRKVSAMRPLMDTYKEQISTSEARMSAMLVEQTKLEFALGEMRTKVVMLEDEKARHMETIDGLEDRLKEKEFEVVNRSTDDPEQNDVTSLKSKAAQMEAELERLRKYKSSEQSAQERVLYLENMLEDAKGLRTKFEADYLQAVQRNMALENELTQLRAVSATMSPASPPQGDAAALQQRLADTMSQLTILRQKLADAEIALQSQSQHPLRSPTPNAGPGGFSTPDEAGVQHEKMKRKVDESSEEVRKMKGQINKLLLEKDQLQSALVEVKDELIQLERSNSDLKAALAAMESRDQNPDEVGQKLAAATQKMVQMTEQNMQLHKALKKAKEYIQSQDKQLKDINNVSQRDNFAEAAAAYEAAIKEKTIECDRLRQELTDTRNAARREQKIMLSAWYNYGMKTMQQKGTGYGLGHVPPSGSGASAAMRAGARNAAGGSQQSWLAQQRSNLGGNLKRRA